MFNKILLAGIIMLLVACSTSRRTQVRLPDFLKGDFVDDYNIKYEISDTMFFQQPNAKYRVIEWNKQAGYMLTKNDAGNPSEAGKYSRIDYVTFNGMEPYTWGFCLAVYNADNAVAARQAPPSNKAEPKKGCNGFPFSRMKRVALMY